MSKREPLMEQQYFDDAIKFIEGTFGRFEVRIQTPGTKPDHQRKLLYKMFLDELELLLTKYSAGYPIAGMREEFAKVIERRERHQKFMGRLGVDFAAIDDYEQSLWLVSLAVLLGEFGPLRPREGKQQSDRHRQSSQRHTRSYPKLTPDAGSESMQTAMRPGGTPI